MKKEKNLTYIKYISGLLRPWRISDPSYRKPTRNTRKSARYPAQIRDE